MGSVWAARNELTDRDFAIKLLLPELAQTRETLHRFFLEARACGQIKHPAVVAVYDMGQAEDGTPYLVMELMEGEGLDQRLTRSNHFRPGEAASFVAFLARGLEEAHVRGLVHRDLKPGNIFFALDDRGEVVPKVLDFGVTKATNNADPKFVRTNTGAVLGSPAYMSPEQARGEDDIDGRSDIWSLGVILYECLTGGLPFDGPNYNALMVCILMDKHKPAKDVNPEIPAEISELIDLTLEKDRQKRIGTARELAERLEGIVQRVTGTPYPGFSRRFTVPPPPATPMQLTVPNSTRTPKKPLGRIGLVSGVVLAVAMIAIGGIAFARQQQPVVAVAARAANVLEADLDDFRQDLQKLPRLEGPVRPVGEVRRPNPKSTNEEGLVIEPEELPDSTMRGGVPRKKTNAKRDAHGGVTSPGF